MTAFLFTHCTYSLCLFNILLTPFLISPKGEMIPPLKTSGILEDILKVEIKSIV